jgi:hypothetical protein
MSGWGLALLIIGVCVVWFVVQKFYFGPAEQQFKDSVRKCLDKQSLKHNGSVGTAQGQPLLTIPYQKIRIQVSLIEYNDMSTSDHTFARFKTEAHNGQQFRIIRDSKDILTKPLVIGTRVAVPDDDFGSKYIVTGDDAAFVNEVLSQEIRDKLVKNELQVKFGRRTDVSRLNRERGWLTVFKGGMRAEDEVFDVLIETAILFYERLEGK